MSAFIFSRCSKYWWFFVATSFPFHDLWLFHNLILESHRICIKIFSSVHMVYFSWIFPQPWLICCVVSCLNQFNATRKLKTSQKYEPRCFYKLQTFCGRSISLYALYIAHTWFHLHILMTKATNTFHVRQIKNYSKWRNTWALRKFA